MDLRKDYSEADLVKLMLDMKPGAAPGTEWRYNNGGYVMLGVLVRRVTGHFYGDELAERVFKPLGMRTARIISEADIIPNRAAGYEKAPKGLVNQGWVSPSLNTTADGALYLSLLDYLKWDAGLASDKFLKSDSLSAMWTPATIVKDGKKQAVGYGFGWLLPTIEGVRLIEHSGAWQGFVTYIARRLDERTLVVVLTNVAARSPLVIGRKILNLLDRRIPLKFTLPE